MNECERVYKFCELAVCDALDGDSIAATERFDKIVCSS